MMLPKKISKISEANHTVGLLLERLGFLQCDIWVDVDVPGRLSETSLWLLPFMKDLDCGSSLLIEEFSWDYTSSLSLFLRLILN